jgi:hypothetical protein
MSDIQPAGEFLLYQSEHPTCKPFLQVRQKVGRPVRLLAPQVFEPPISNALVALGTTRKQASRPTNTQKGLK